METAGLMEGLAGMGLALLKLAEPARIPNVLILEPASAGWAQAEAANLCSSSAITGRIGRVQATVVP